MKKSKSKKSVRSMYADCLFEVRVAEWGEWANPAVSQEVAEKIVGHLAAMGVTGTIHPRIP